MNEQKLFLSALEIETTEARRRYLVSECSGDTELLARVEALLASHERQSKFLNMPAVKQIVGDSPEGMAPTVSLGNSASEDDDAQDFYKSGTSAGGEIPLGCLQPSSKPGSLGRLGHYEILELIGSGAFGTVLKAFDEKLQRVVAIKVLLPEMAAASPARKRFLREARSSAQVRQENVVNIYAVENDPIPYLVMEYVPGQTLQQRLDEHGPLDLIEVLRLGKQIADGLAAAHAQGLIHRDVKPGNILIDTSVDHHVKITDFGLARTADDASMTQSGMIAGTPLYMAPEQTLGQKLDQRADLFSLGSVLYQMLSGRPPFRAPTTVAVLRRVAEDHPRPIQEVIPEVPDWMCQIVGHLHAKNPDARYGSEKEVSDLLADCLTDVQENRTPKHVAPERDAGENELDSRNVVPRNRHRSSEMPFLKIAAGVLILLFGLGITEATGVTDLSSTVIRLATGSGTLVIETDDPDMRVSIDGEVVTIRGSGIEELSLTPGSYEFAATKDGEPVKRELVTITRNNRTVVTMSLESGAPEAGLAQPTPRRSGLGSALDSASPPPQARAPRDADRRDAPMLSPFTEVQFNRDQVFVTYDSQECQWLALDDLKVEEIVASAQKQFGERWKKRISEDLVEVLWGMNHNPGVTVKLRLLNLKTKRDSVVENAPMTEENRNIIYRKRRLSEGK